LCLRAALPHLAAAGGHAAAVNVSSGAGVRGFAMLADYVASKHAVIGLTRSAALEYARQGVRINVVCPGTVRTPMLAAFAGSDEGLDKMGRMSPIGRLGSPDEIAAAIAWLCSDAASFVTGAVLEADGGVAAA
jgi:NAD(P)-dependent dehydrogenase (short-subunit alcohol dehydrogenase family)